MGGRAKLYPDRETALTRFRLQPPQPCENQYILEYIARHSLLGSTAAGRGNSTRTCSVTLKGAERLADDYKGLRCKLGVIYGANSELFSKRTLEYMRELVPQDFPATAIADAQHHVFLDQPQRFIEALQEMLDDAEGVTRKGVGLRHRLPLHQAVGRYSTHRNDGLWLSGRARRESPVFPLSNGS